ncbi:MAG TPA: hypothetical protein VF292_01960 [Rhodanobacteraceae bacterium]
MDDARRAAPRTEDSPQSYSALQAVLPHVLATFKREPALALTACYLFIALAGIYFAHYFYQRGFGIPVLTLSQVGDFLVAGLQQPMALVLLVSTLPLCWVFDLLNQRTRRKRAAKIATLEALPKRSWWQARRLRYLRWRNNSMWMIQLVYVIVVVGYGSVFIGVYAQYRAGEVRHGDVPRVVIRLNGEPANLPAVDPKGWGYLGAVSNYVFVYDPVAKRALVLPVNAIERMQPEAVNRRTGPSLPVVRIP